VRRRVIASAEKLTGGRVELGELTPSRSACALTRATDHPRPRSRDEAPFLHVDRVQAEMKIIAIFSTTVGLHSLALDHPVLHLIDYPTAPPMHPCAGRPPANYGRLRGRLSNLSHFPCHTSEVQQGELLCKTEVPFEFAAAISRCS